MKWRVDSNIGLQWNDDNGVVFNSVKKKSKRKETNSKEKYGKGTKIGKWNLG